MFSPPEVRKRKICLKISIDASYPINLEWDALFVSTFQILHRLEHWVSLLGLALLLSAG